MDYDLSEVATGQAPPASAGGTMTVGRKKYAVNLYWQPSPSGRVSQAAREAAAQPGQMADFYAVRPGTSNRIPQFALGQKEYGHRVGQPSAAASLAEDQPGSWAGVFSVNEGWWLVVSRDDLIAPDGDILFADENDARQRLYEEINLGGLQRIYAPENWAVPGGDPMPLTLLLQGRSDSRLQYVKFPVKTVAIVLLVIGAIAGLGYLAMSYQRSQLSEFEQSIADLTPEQQAVARAEHERLLAPPPPPPPPVRYWEKEPRPEVFLEACHQAMMQAPAVTLGWKRGNIICDGHNLSIEWNRTHGPALNPVNAAVANAGAATSSIYPLANLEPRGQEELWQNGQLAELVMKSDLPLASSPLPDDVTKPAVSSTGQQSAAPPPPWIKKKITLSSDNAPWYGWNQYQGIPGLIVNSITWDGGKSWKIEGTFYEMR